MNIGEFQTRNNALYGSIATVTVDLPKLGLRPVQSDNSKAPTFEIMALNVAKRWVQIGALWVQKSNSTGEIFYQGKLDDPSLSEPLQIMLFGDDQDGYRVVWVRPEVRRENMDGTRQNRRAARQDDGFGTGNATTDGQLVPAGPADLDDDMPF